MEKNLSRQILVHFVVVATLLRMTETVTFHSDDIKTLPEDLFKDVFNFNTFDTVIQLGGATSDISEMVLRHIERTIKGIERQERDRLVNRTWQEPVVINVHITATARGISEVYWK